MNCNSLFFHLNQSLLIALLLFTSSTNAQTIVSFTPKDICEGDSIQITLSGVELEGSTEVYVLFPYQYIDFFGDVDEDVVSIEATVVDTNKVRTKAIFIYNTIPIPLDSSLNLQVEIDGEASSDSPTTLKVRPNSLPVIIGELCDSEQSQSYEAVIPTDVSIDYSYQWQVNGGNIEGTADSNAVKVNWSNSEGILSLETINSLGCVSQLEENITIGGSSDGFPLFLSSNLEDNTAAEGSEVLFTAFAEGADSYEFWIDNELEQDASTDNELIYEFTSEGFSLTGLERHVIRVVAEKGGRCEEASLVIEVAQHPFGRPIFFFDAIGGMKKFDHLFNANELFAPIFAAYPAIDEDIYKVEYFGAGILFNGNDEKYYFNPGLAGEGKITIVVRAIHRETRHTFIAFALVFDLTEETKFWGIEEAELICGGEDITFSPDFTYLSDSLEFDTIDYQFLGVKIHAAETQGEIVYLDNITRISGLDSLAYTLSTSNLPTGKYIIDILLQDDIFGYTFSAGFISIEITDSPDKPIVLPFIPFLFNPAPKPVFNFCSQELPNAEIQVISSENTINWYDKENNLIPDVGQSPFKVTNLIQGNNSVDTVYVTQQSESCESVPIEVVINTLGTPIVSFEIDGLCENSTPIFTNTSIIPDGIAVNWNWNFGDGTASTLKNPPPHVYNNDAPGSNYTVLLTATTSDGCLDSKDSLIIFQSNEAPIFDWINTCQNNTLQFSAPIAQDSSAVWNWDFGDGTTGTGAMIVHEYPKDTIYTVSLEVDSEAFCTDSIAVDVFVLSEVLLNEFHFNNFEAANNGWIQDLKKPNDWEWGMPAGNTIDQTMGNAWVTGLSASYTPDIISLLDAPCFDFSEMQKPMLQMDYWSDSRLGLDGAVIQFAFGSDSEWFLLGDKFNSKGINWYDTDDIVANPGNQLTKRVGWSGKSGKWRNSRHPLDELTGKENVRFRILMASTEGEATETTGLDGFAFDNFIIQERTKVVLIEHFADNDLGGISEVYDKLYGEINQNQSDVLMIQYHLGDNIHAQNLGENNVRALYYEFPSTADNPSKAVLDGNIYSGNTLNSGEIAWADTSLSHRVLRDNLFNIHIDQFSINGTNLQINTTVNPNGNLPTILTNAIDNGDIVVQTVVVEDSLATPKGILRNVMRKMLPNAAGSLYTTAAGQSFSDSWVIPNTVNNFSNLNVIVFVQNVQTREVYQVSSVKQPSLIFTALEDHHFNEQLSLNLHPNPADNQLEVITKLPNSSNYYWQLTNMQGIVLKKGMLHHEKKQFQLNTAELEEGMYYFTLFSANNEQLISEKVVILH